MSDHQAPVHRCGEPACPVDWLYDQHGPSDPAWRARVKAELDAAPSLVAEMARRRWQRRQQAS